MRQRLVGHRVHRLPQQLPALLDLVGGHVVQSGVVRVLVVRLLEPGIEFGENRVLRPGFPRRPGLGEFGQPQFQALVARVAAQQPMQCGGAGAGQSGDEDRGGDRHLGVLRILLPRRLAEQSCHQRVAQEEPRHLAADLGEVGVAAVGLQQHRQRLDVVVVVGAEVVEAYGLDGGGLEFLDGPDVGARGGRPFARGHALYSPQFTSSVAPVIPLDRSLAMNRMAEATSSSVGRRLRSEFTAAAW